MCLAIPGKVLEIYDENGIKMGRIDYAGAINHACLEYIPEIEVGQYCIVHAGFAINMLNEEEAQAALVELQRLSDIIAAEDDHT